MLPHRHARPLGAPAGRRRARGRLDDDLAAETLASGRGEPLVGTNPLAIAVPSSDGKPLVTDVSMGAVTHGDVLAGLAAPEELVPFGGPHAHKAFALALGLQLLADALGVRSYGAVLLVARPEADPVPELRRRVVGLRLPGDS